MAHNAAWWVAKVNDRTKLVMYRII